MHMNYILVVDRKDLLYRTDNFFFPSSPTLTRNRRHINLKDVNRKENSLSQSFSFFFSLLFLFSFCLTTVFLILRNATDA